MNKCGCGCCETPAPDSRGRPRKFQQGHGMNHVKATPLKLCQCGCRKYLHNPRYHKYLMGHNRRGRRSPREEYDNRRGSNNYNWKGGRPISSTGYKIWADKSDPNAYNKQGHRYEHRIVMARYLGRPLMSNEIVHHVNEDKLDNRIENLKLMTKGEHNSLHFTKDFLGRHCILCKSKSTYIYRGRPWWYRHPITKEEWICRKCRERLIK
jgi:hypothetical protein